MGRLVLDVQLLDRRLRRLLMAARDCGVTVVAVRQCVRACVRACFLPSTRYRMAAVVVSSLSACVVYWQVVGQFDPRCYGLVAPVGDPQFWWIAVAAPLLLVLTLYFAEILHRVVAWWRTGELE